MHNLYQQFHDWRIGLYQRLPNYPTELLRAIVGDMQQAIERINEELKARDAAQAASEKE